MWSKLHAAGIAQTSCASISSRSIRERDTPEQLAKYVGYFSKEFVAATGSDEELTQLTRALGLVYAREPTGNGDYTVDHSASAVIIDPNGRQVGLFRPPFDADEDRGRSEDTGELRMMRVAVAAQYLRSAPAAVAHRALGDALDVSRRGRTS